MLDNKTVFTDNDCIVTEAVEMDVYRGDIFQAFARALDRHLSRDQSGHRRLSEMMEIL